MMEQVPQDSGESDGNSFLEHVQVPVDTQDIGGRSVAGTKEKVQHSIVSILGCEPEVILIVLERDGMGKSREYTSGTLREHPVSFEKCAI